MLEMVCYGLVTVVLYRWWIGTLGTARLGMGVSGAKW